MCCKCTKVYEETYERGSHRSPSDAVIDALAVAEGADPMDLPPLQRSIDVDALDRLFERNGRTDRRSAVLSWTVNGWNVFVRDDGRVAICDPDRSSDPSPIFDDDSELRTVE